MGRFGERSYRFATPERDQVTEQSTSNKSAPNFSGAIDTPWKVQSEIFRCLAYPWVRILFAFYRIPWGIGWRFYGIPVIQKHRQSTMSFGPDLQLRSSFLSNPLGPNHPVILCSWAKGSCLTVGAHFAMTGGSICAAEQVIIGDHVAVGANSIIVDTDFHPLDPTRREAYPVEANTAPVMIEDHVFIGMNCLILKGVTIGRGSVIGAGSVVSRSIQPGVIAAGNPVRVLREI
jgi:acetyltransferase-like isoleucine patch superfamily enzyme